jgi:putative nucleotidyltransferase with HDIG domain
LPKEAQDLVWGYFAVAEAGEVLSYLLSQVEGSGARGQTPEAPLGLLSDTLLVWTQHFFTHDNARTPQSLAAAHSLVAALARGLGTSGNSRETVSGLRRHDAGLFSHCLNVCLLTLASAPSLGWAGEAAQTLALGALLHDLGMMPWAQETFHQTGPLSDEDWEKIKGHPARGAELLKPFAEIPEEVRLAISQHHESVNGSGYPLGLHADDLHPWAKVLRIIDSYEAMTSLRPWRPPISERQAWRIMNSAWLTQGIYDPEHLRSFLAFCQGRED